MNQANLNSWGNFPQLPQTGHHVNWRNELAYKFSLISNKHQNTLAFGNGRSYGDSCLAASGHAIVTRNLNRFIAADWQSGVIKAEAGVTIAEILEVSIPRGWFIAVTPGTKFVTLGGAIANDVHGKNHHVRGTFGKHVLSFDLLRSDQSVTHCSESENNQLFCATIGGLGLSGIIATVELQLMPIKSSKLKTQTQSFSSLAEFFTLAEHFDNSNEYGAAWVDCVGRGKNLGRGIYFAANHCESGELQVSNKKKITVPFTPPFSLFNSLSLQVLNNLYYHKNRTTKIDKISDYEPFFYPLDGILQWNRIYGRKGFQQYQCVIPQHNALDAVSEILKQISASQAGSFLAVLKSCGDIKSPGLLSFPIKGTSLALDFAQRDIFNDKLFKKLDQITKESGGRLYPAKDAHMSAADFKTFYPNWLEVEKLRDPALNSHFWKRVTQ